MGAKIFGSVAAVALVVAMVFGASGVRAPVAGSSTIGVSTEEMKAVALGWSAKKKILGKSAYNDKNEKIGVVGDLIITPDKSVSYAIVGVGGFLGIGKHDAAISDRDKIVLTGANKDVFKSMPKFEYAK